MIVLEVNFVSDENDFISMSTNVLGLSRDNESNEEKIEFETDIIPFAYEVIEEKFKNVNLNTNENLCADMMNVLVRRAKKFDYVLNRIGQNKKFPDTYQLEFKKQPDKMEDVIKEEP